jgi:hypothetical protein
MAKTNAQQASNQYATARSPGKEREETVMAATMRLRPGYAVQSAFYPQALPLGKSGEDDSRSVYCSVKVQSA